MKKNILIISLSLLSSSLFSQDSGLDFGVKAGANLSKYTTNFEINGYNPNNFERKTGFYLGGFMNYEVSDIIKLQPEIVLAAAGSKNTIPIEARGEMEIITGDFKTRITDYTLNLPLLAQVYPTKNFYFEAGPQMEYILEKDNNIQENPFDDFNSEPFQETDMEYDRFDLGAALGLGYLISENLSVNARYYAGLLGRDFIETKSSVFNLGLNYNL
ncbi:MAG: porin family protein [Christiangramia sp.]|nr:porin family protein [Christiangramia sp.]